MNELNYNNDDKSSSPFKKGDFKDIVKSKKRPRFTRSSYNSDKDEIDLLTIDLVQVLADVGIVISSMGIRNIAKSLIKLGWSRHRKIIKNVK